MNVSAANSSCAPCVGDNLNSPFTITIICSLMITGLVANILLLVAHHKDPLNCFHNASTYFLHNIAINDCLFIVLALVMVVLAVKTHGPLFFKSKFLPFLKFFVQFCSSFLGMALSSLAIERFISVAYPLFHHVVVTKDKIQLWVGVLWTAPFVFIGIDQAVSSACRDFEFLGEVVLLSVFLTACLVFYIASFVSIKQQQKRFKDTRMADLDRRSLDVKLQNERRFLATISIASVLPFVLFTPCFAFMLPDVNLEERTSGDLYRTLEVTFSFLFLGHSLLNPFLYLWRLPKYRKTFRRLYCGLCKA